eukprot:2987636-Rhodomonas_salina.1
MVLRRQLVLTCAMVLRSELVLSCAMVLPGPTLQQGPSYASSPPPRAPPERGRDTPLASYAMSGTAIRFPPSILPGLRYAMSGTEVEYHARLVLCGVRYRAILSRTLRPRP